MGRFPDLAAVNVGGDGVAGLGAIDNRGTQPVLNAINNLTLTTNTTLAATTNNWGITTADTNGTPGTFLGHNYKLTKTGAKELWIATRSDTELGDIEIATNSGRLVFAGLGTQLGHSASNVVVRTNAQLGFANGIQATGKNVTLQPGGSIYVFGGTNQFGGSIVMNTNGVSTNGIVWTDFNAELTLSGNLSGPAGLQLRSTAQPGTAGRLVLSGTNSYTGRTRVTDGTLAYASTNAFSGTNIVLAGRVTANISGTPVLQLLSNVVSPASVRLEMNVGGDTNLVPGLAYSKCELTGEGGTWGGPIWIGGTTNKQSQVYFSGGSLGLTVAGPIDGTNFVGSTLDSNGGCHLVGESASAVNGEGPGLRFNGPLYIKGSVLMTQTGLGGFPNMTKLILGSAGNNWDFLICQRGMIQIGAHNAIPLAPISLGNGFPSADHRVVFDLNGYNQAIASLSVLFGDNDPFWFGNSSTTADSVLTYAGTGTNLWSGIIVDALDTNAPIQKTTALSVTSGYLMLRPIPEGHLNPNNFNLYKSGAPTFNVNPYTGPTTVSGGILHVNRNLGPSPVSVTGGTLCGSNGVFLGPVTIAAGGTLAPGQPITVFGLGGLGSAAPIASLNVNNDLSLGGTCVMDVNLTTGNHDQLVVSGNLTYGGTLVINNLGSQVITNGTILPLFSAATYTAGAVVVQPAPAFGLRWDTSFLALDGTLRVAPVNTTPVPITATVSGGGTSLDLSWPADHIGWLLQGQTNGLGVGITTSWFGIAGSTITNQIQVPIVPGNPAVFFRLVHP